jgi:uncharacterized peroxidase-related enzyme
MTVLSNLGPDASIGDILFAQPERFMPILGFANDVMRGDSELAPSTRELLAAFVSGLNDCTFCHGVHEATAQRFGIEPALLSGLVNDVGQSDIAENLRPIFTFAKKLTLEPSKVSDTERAQVLKAGHSEAALKDVIAIVSLFSFFNRLVDGHGVSGNADIFARDSEMLHSFGYAPPPQ